MSKTLIIGREGQQSEVIVDKTVSREHLVMTMTVNKDKPYHVKLMRPEQTLIVNGQNLFESDINEEDQVLIGKNRFLLDTKQLINDFRKMQIDSENKMKKVKNAICVSQKQSSNFLVQDKRKTDTRGYFFLSNVAILVLLALSFVLKSSPVAYIITLLVILFAVVCSIYLYMRTFKN